MRKKLWNAGARNDWLMPLGKEPVMVEITPAPERNHLKVFGEQIMRLLGINLQKCTGSGYRTYGKYRVKETFAGEESLTSLLTADALCGTNVINAMLRRKIHGRKESL